MIHLNSEIDLIISTKESNSKVINNEKQTWTVGKHKRAYILRTIKYYPWAGMNYLIPPHTWTKLRNYKRFECNLIYAISNLTCRERIFTFVQYKPMFVPNGVLNIFIVQNVESKHIYVSSCGLEFQLPYGIKLQPNSQFHYLIVWIVIFLNVNTTIIFML